MAGITHLREFQDEGLQALVDLTEEQRQETFADQYLPDEPAYTRHFAYDIVRTNEYIAAYIGFGAEPPYIDRDEISKRVGEVAFFALADIMTYEELQAIHEARSDSEKRATIDKLIGKNVKILNGLRRLMYVAKMEALFIGRHYFGKPDGEKNQVYFDYGIPETNKIALTAGNDFDTANFDIIGFLEEHVQKYKDANEGKAPEVMLGSSELRGKMQRNQLLITEAGRPEGSQRISVSELNEVLSDFGLPAFTVVEERSVRYKRNGDNAMTEKELVPINRLTFLSKGVGTYMVGPTLENGFKPGLRLIAEDLRRPIRSIVEGYGAGFPKPSQPSLIYHMDVFTP